jgi:hypothetical protein
MIEVLKKIFLKPKKEYPVMNENRCYCDELKASVGFCNDCPIHGIVGSYSGITGIKSERHWDTEKKEWVLDKGVKAFSYGRDDERELD